MSEFWLISAPGDKTNLQAWERMNTVTSKSNLSSNSKFHIPDLKVGTLDALVGLSDELGKLDSFAERMQGTETKPELEKISLVQHIHTFWPVIKKIAQYIGEVMEDSKDKVQENLLANGGGRVRQQLQNMKLGLHSQGRARGWQDVHAAPQKDPNVEDFLEVVKSETKLERLTESQRSDISYALNAFDQTLNNPEYCCWSWAQIDLISYLTRFEWDMAKYPIKQPLKSISEALAKQVTQIETDLKTRSAAYNNIKGNLQSLEKKTVGNLLTRTLADIVHKEDFVLNSEYLITLLVVVPKSSYIQWQKTYESLSDMVVPRSTKMIAEDAEGGLFTVTLFRKVMDDFKAKARENRFMVREFYFDEKELKCEKEELMKLASDKKQQYGPLLRWLKVNFSEAFVAWIHVKALRVFVESVLRYGLPVNFQAMLLQPNRKSVKRLRDVLNVVFKHLDEVAAASIMDPGMDIPGLQLSNQEYYPYVYFNIDLGLLDCS